MRHSAIHAQNGALSNNGHSRLTIEDNRLSDAHGANVSLTSSTGARLRRNDISRSGQEGVHMTAADDVTIQGNTIHHNNTEQFSEAKRRPGPVVRHRLSERLRSATTACTATATWGFSSRSATGPRSSATPCGRTAGPTRSGVGGAGIVIASSSNAEVYHDTVAWNADGISVIAQNRGSEGRTVGNHVHDNTVVMAPPGEYLSGWFQDWAGTLFRSESSNRGANSR